MKHYFQFLMIFVGVVVFGLLSTSCSKESSDKVDLDLGKEGKQCREESPKCEDGLTCDETNICIKIVEEDKCEKDVDCKEGYECKDKVCVAKEEEPELACDPVCSNDKYCKDGVCEDRCPEGMAFIPSGEFNMGAEDQLVTIHQVTLTKDFCMDKYEFTNGDKKNVESANTKLDAGGIDTDGITPKIYQWTDLETGYDPAIYLGFYADNHPLIGVNWYIAKKICELQGKRLPTEAEWEYSARGGEKNDTDCKFGTKDCADPDKDNACWTCGLPKTRACGKKSTCVVGVYNSPNAFGLHDMSGNVYEWVADWATEDYQADNFDPTGPNVGTYKILRGGSWFNDDPDSLRVSSRYASYPYNRSNFFGFRCAVEAK